MLVPLQNITYNVQEAIEYYEQVKNIHGDLMWTKKEINDYADMSNMQLNERIDSFLNFVGRVEPFISWTPDQILEFIEIKSLEYTGKAHAWYIKLNSDGRPHPKIDRQHELQFGFAKKLLDMFPDALTVELVVNPVGTKYNRHTDKGDLFRVIIPIIADSGAVWHFDDCKNITQFPGHAYMLLKQFPHATDVFGPNDRVSIHFQLKSNLKNWITELNCHI